MIVMGRSFFSVRGTGHAAVQRFSGLMALSILQLPVPKGKELGLMGVPM